MTIGGKKTGSLLKGSVRFFGESCCELFSATSAVTAVTAAAVLLLMLGKSWSGREGRSIAFFWWDHFNFSGHY